ncbi:hypothetical protein SEA_FORZA_57 [Gordonia phage Forza]|uniref:Uncharacterized protein n=1 Tax=Gordonia phage Forza TaxID=2571247 RepID=A0A650EYB8_9CAUD|nr:hypothetical protein PP303_gp057 [Gordonia phage Forza]QEM41527.1 hypothetical protein SEA_BOOPY_58 [Gordonia phage Boopy]QGT55050.1 hypothetical protein SEA_FORZA_57 [Gordonia phage Forza]UXE04200.1 hypothetical protein SEA_BLUENGOLD_56 [Gordonia phage BlueNGold]WBF03839.1 hypothetical protein SEA_MAREELIH_56 [Gordonia phage Mareelih]
MKGYLNDKEYAKLLEAAAILADHGERQLAETLVSLAKQGSRW